MTRIQQVEEAMRSVQFDSLTEELKKEHPELTSRCVSGVEKNGTCLYHWRSINLTDVPTDQVARHVASEARKLIEDDVLPALQALSTIRVIECSGGNVEGSLVRLTDDGRLEARLSVYLDDNNQSKT